MKTVILHGEDIGRSRTRFAEIVHGVKAKGWQIVNLNEDITSIREQLTSASLFPDESLYILEKIQAVTVKDSDWLKNNIDNIPGSLLVYHKADMSKKYRDLFPKSSKVEQFNVPKTVFVFLDNLRPNNTANSLKLMETVFSNENPEFVFALVARTFRDLYWARLGGKGMSYQDWRIIKLKSQAVRFSEEELRNIIRYLSDADIRSKSSDASALEALELLVASDYKVSYNFMTDNENRTHRVEHL